MSHEVFFILNPCFEGDLWDLSRGGHVWLINSTRNQVIARAVWDRETEDYSPEHGVTTFDSSAETVETFYSLLGTIEQHHGEYSATRPWDAIHVIGVSSDSVQPDRIAGELGLDAVMMEDEQLGFAIRRS